ncbi:hypothetical protein CVT26_001007 [Gymnopilus dilepis]|uniref:Cytosine-purine permease n=1 Tax=Gymnopilus dilepis TaxID=231916 RepID=A0A409Y289_9AGAR|nr:hypothetical protein CVT26_001007 [Gymnopilus dilepis]
MSVIVSFFGYRFLHWFERFAWIPVLIGFIIAAGVSGKHLNNLPPDPPATAARILGFVVQQVGYTITWSGLSADYGVYLQPVGSRSLESVYLLLYWFLPTQCGSQVTGYPLRFYMFSSSDGHLFLQVLLQSFGAAAAIAASTIPSWSNGFAGGNVGGLIESIFRPLGDFGQFLTVIMSLSVAPNLVAAFYSASVNYQVIVPRLFVAPRYIFTLLTAAIVLPLAIVGAHRFDAAITNFLGLIGYWASAYVIILLIEHFYFRSNKFSNYDLDIWNDPKRLPWGLGALGAGVLSFSLVIPCMSQVWFTGPLAKKTGDLGFEIAFVLSGILYPPMRWFERFAWIPVLIGFIIAAGVGGKHLTNLPPAPPATAAGILGFVGQQAGFIITWSGFSADYGAYLQPVGSSWKVFIYSFLGIFLPNVLVQSLGAAVAIAATATPSWSDKFAGGNVGGLIEAIYQPLGNFGKFLTVVMSLSVAPNLVTIFYSASLNYQVIVPRLFIVPRYFFTLLTVAIVLPLAIVGAHRFDAAITNFLGLIGYWASAYVIILLIEHVYFRSNKFSNYDLDIWNDPKRLPWGLGALGAGVLSFALVIPCMSQVWFTGPLAKKTGDLGFEVALVLSGILYPPMRLLEIKLMGHL